MHGIFFYEWFCSGMGQWEMHIFSMHIFSACIFFVHAYVSHQRSTVRDGMVCNSTMIYDGLVVQGKDTQILIILGTAMFLIWICELPAELPLPSEHSEGALNIQNLWTLSLNIYSRPSEHSEGARPEHSEMQQAIVAPMTTYVCVCSVCEQSVLHCYLWGHLGFQFQHATTV